MPIDTSIYGLINKPQPINAGPTPFENAGQLMQIKQMIDQGQLHGLQRGELERSIAEKGRLRDLFSRGNVKPEEVMAIDPQTGMSYQKNMLESQKSEAELADKRAATVGKNMSILRDLAAQATDDAGFRVLKEATFRLFGPEQAARIPDRFDPEVQKRMVMTADQLLERLSPKLNMTDTGSQVQPTNPYTGAPQGNPLAKAASPEAVMADKRQREEFTAQAPQRTAALEKAKREIEKLGEDIKQGRATKEGAIQTYDVAIGTLDRLVKHPGFTQTVGAALIPGQRFIPGTEAANFDAELTTFKSQIFLPMVQNLRGMGQLSDAEGKKLSEAVGALTINMGEKAFKESVGRIKADLSKTRSRLSGQQAPSSRGATGQWDAPTGSGIKFLGFE